MACGGQLLVNGLKLKEQSLYRGPSKDVPYQVLIHLAKWFQIKKKIRNQPIRNKNGLWWPCLLMDRDKMANHYRGPSIDASYQISVHLGKWFQRRRLFRNQPIRNNKMNCELMLTYDTLALRQTGSRNLTGQQKLPMIWGTFMKLVTK